MDFNIIWKCLIIFNFLFTIIWVSFYTYRAPFMNDNDFMAPGENTRGFKDAKDNKDSSLSFPGRSLIFLIAIISAVVITIFFFIIYDNLVKPGIRCKKGAKNLKDCKLIK